jgi:alkanesulfonate monooxygenase SsuD/methylene tetrahydromethanopterin reductase-like flavin-dependent oxidoreductase (luciferase family)
MPSWRENKPGQETPAMQFGIFDHLDQNGLPLADFYEQRLELIAEYERLGFYCYHLAEHHGTPLGTAPSPGIFLSAIAQRTSRLLFGPLVYVLALHQPIRLIEEICMLDQLSRGRFQLGIGKGISSHLENRLYGLEEDDVLPRYAEAAEIVIAGLTHGVVNFEGKIYRFSDVPFHVTPYQKPHPPLWYGVGGPDSCTWAARHRVNIVSNAAPAMVRRITDRYRLEWVAVGHDGPLPKLGMNRHVVIAETDEAAEAIADRAYNSWYRSFMHLWHRNGLQPKIGYPESFAELQARGMGIAGTTETVRRMLARQVDEAGVNYLLVRLAFGDLSAAETTHTARQFAEHVMPALRELAVAV